MVMLAALCLLGWGDILPRNPAVAVIMLIVAGVLLAELMLTGPEDK